MWLQSPPGSSECLREAGVDYSSGPENNIFDWQGLTEEHCASLTASTTGGQFWTYKASERRCWVKRTNNGRKTMSGIVSGNRACGDPLTGKISDFGLIKCWRHCNLEIWYFPGCLIEPDKSYAGHDIFRGGIKLQSMKGCVVLALYTTSATSDTKQLFWMYQMEKKRCYVMFFRSRTGNIKGHISGSSDCGYQPPDSGQESGC